MMPIKVFIGLLKGSVGQKRFGNFGVHNCYDFVPVSDVFQGKFYKFD